MIERISPDNPLTERHTGMMAVLRNKVVKGPIEFWFGPKKNEVFVSSVMLQTWGTDGRAINMGEGEDIIAVLPMPDLIGLEEDNGG